MKTLKEIILLHPNPFDKQQLARITKAYAFAQEAHKGQLRKSGDPYFVHPVETAAILSKMGMGSITITAALLHDVYEDTDVTLEQIEKEFGKEVAFIVKGVTKLGKIQLKGSDEEYFLDNLRNMFLAMSRDIRVVLIRLADRLHNMRTLEFHTPEKQKRIAKETMEIYVPIANRFSIGEIRGELEDLCFKYLDPKNYNLMKKLEEDAYRERDAYVKLAIGALKKELKKNKVKVLDIHGRAKRYHSLFLKLQAHDMKIESIYDLVAIRIIVPTVSACYEALGIVHQKYKPLIGRIKDYISLPKPNGYRSIHTTVFGPMGKIMEVQIRSERMHNEAEYGIAAHWIYAYRKENDSWLPDWKQAIFGRDHRQKVPENELDWVKQLKDWNEETEKAPDEFLQSLRIDFFKNHIFAFTPMGDVIDLPEGSTPIDFAYAIHSDVGNQASAALINRKMSSLDTKIHNGDMVEIVTAKDKKMPSRDWLEFVKTAGARSKIKSALRKGGVEVV